MCLGLLKINDLIASTTVVCPSESYLFLFTDGIDRETIQKIIAEDPELLNRHTAEGLCGQIQGRWARACPPSILHVVAGE